jgi:hypothetical protein
MENTEVSTETDRAKDVLNIPGIDGLVIDAELEYEYDQLLYRRRVGSGTLLPAASAATLYCQGILDVHKNAVLAYSPIWNPIVHSGFPYTTFNTYTAAVMPQAYASAYAPPDDTLLQHVGPAEMIAKMDAAWTTAQSIWINLGQAVVPIVPVAYAKLPVTGTEIAEFVNSLKTDSAPATISGKYDGVSFFDVNSNSQEIRLAIGAATIN